MTSEFEVSTDTPLGAIIDGAIRKLAVLDLTEFYLGVQVSYPDSRIRMYFTDGLQEEQLESYKERLEFEDFSIQYSALEKEDSEAAWVLEVSKITKPEREVNVRGSLPVDVPIKGTVDVKNSQSKESTLK